MAFSHSQELELITSGSMPSDPNKSNTAVHPLEDDTPDMSSPHLYSGDDIAATSLSVTRSPGRPSTPSLSPSTSEPPSSAPVNGTEPNMLAALNRSYSVQSTRASAFIMNRSISDLVNNQADNGTLELGLGHRRRARPFAMQHFRAGHHRDAIEVLISRHRLYISLAAFIVMFGMTVAGLWLEIASQHKSIV